MTQPQSAFRRAARPLIGWMTVVLSLVCVVFVIAVLAAMAVGFWLTAAKGSPVPDFTGGLAAVITALVPAWGIAAQWLHTRSAERREETRAGVAPTSPFVPSPPSEPPTPEGGLVNQDAIQ